MLKSGWRQSGNIMLALFAAIGAVGVVGVTSMTVLKGPVRGMHNVTQKTIAENNMIASGKLSIMAASSQPSSGDCDADNTVEPIAWSNTGTGPKPAGGGYLPSNIGASLQDPWNNTYGYCAWDHGTAIQTTCATPTQRLRGEADKSGPVIAVISSGPDRTFQTSCANAPAYVTKVAGSDDIVLIHTYDEAMSLSGGLWNLKSSDQNTAEIKKNLEVKNAADAVVFGVDSTSDISKPSIKVDYVKALANTKVEFLSLLHAGVSLQLNNGANGYFGWGNGTASTMPASDIDQGRPNLSTNSVYRINHHTGLSFSAHTNYGGIRFYNQGYSGADPAATYIPANGASMVMAITGDRVGIGNVSPVVKLDTVLATAEGVAGTGKEGSYPIAKFDALSNSIKRGLEIGVPTGNITSPVYLKVSGTSNRFSILDQSNDENFTITDAGNVGVGVAVPRAKLDVFGQIVGGFGAMTTGGVNDWNDISNTRPGSGYTLLRPTPTSANGPPAGNYFHPFNFEYVTKDGTGSITQLAIPYSDTGSIPYGIWMRGRYGGSWTSWTQVGDNLGNHIASQLAFPSWHGTYDVWLQGGAHGAASGPRNLALLGDKINDRLYLNYANEYSGGTIIGVPVGVNMVSAGPTMHVNGTIAATSWIGAGCEGACEGGGGYSLMYADGTIVGTGGIYGAGFYYNSDQRLKENIARIPETEAKKVLQLEGVTFDWKKDGAHDIGFVAQDVQKIYPELVGENDRGVLSVKYGNVVPLLLELARSQQKEIDQLSETVRNLRTSAVPMTPDRIENMPVTEGPADSDTGNQTAAAPPLEEVVDEKLKIMLSGKDLDKVFPHPEPVIAETLGVTPDIAEAGDLPIQEKALAQNPVEQDIAVKNGAGIKSESLPAWVLPVLVGNAALTLILLLAFVVGAGRAKSD